MAPSLTRARSARFPRGATLGCPCGYTGTVGQVTAHTARGACHGNVLTVLAGGTDPDGADSAGADGAEGADAADGAEDDDPDDGGGEGDAEDEEQERVLAAIHAVEVPPRRAALAPPPPGPAVLSDPWRPVQLDPETHVCYRIACTDPGFGARFGNFVGTVGQFCDQVVRAFFADLGYELGLAPLAAVAGDAAAPAEPVTLTREALTALLQQFGLVVTEAGHHGRSLTPH